MRLIRIHNVETFGGEYEVELFDIAVNVSRFKKKRTGTVYKQRIKHGTERFRAALDALIKGSVPGSQTREDLAACDCESVRAALKRAGG